MADMLFARPDGQWFDFPPLMMAASSGRRLVCPSKADLIPLPAGATLTMMPLAAPYGFDKENGEFLLLAENPYKKKTEPIYALAALLPQGFTRLLLPASTPVPSEKPLPLLGYTAVGIEKGKIMVAAHATDKHESWHPKYYNTPELPQLIEQRLKEYPANSILRQLAYCSQEYGCFTAQNIFYRRFEGGIPVSPNCNASCLGCISLQPAQCCPSPQRRISAPPTAEEIAEVAIPHLELAKMPIVSFGQGCEGEPSLQYSTLARAIRHIRSQTPRGVININTNAGDSQAIASLLEAGLDSLRVSLFSPFAAEYAAYHRPRDFGLAQVKQSLRLAKEARRPIALNLLTYPGFTDHESRYEALCEFIAETGVSQIQLRNLNIDPAVMVPFCADSWGIGLRNFITRLQTALPELAIGSYSKAGKAEML
ncbi:MAG: radical SAM protein [Clostridiales bacterium]|nr:radical SAM protein [Clostridiales bacterium]